VEVTVHAQPVALGSLHHTGCPELIPLRDGIRKGGLTCELTDAIGKDLWAKMLFNCSLNPLGAIFNVPYGELKESPHTRAIMSEIVREIFAVIHASGFESYWNSPGEYYDFLLDTLIPRTALHESSTLQDIRLKKKTEIDALTGAIVALGKAHGIPVPVNSMLYEMIRFMENRYLH
jgi:2-dehydropantoate 2-reductase